MTYRIYSNQMVKKGKHGKDPFLLDSRSPNKDKHGKDPFWLDSISPNWTRTLHAYRRPAVYLRGAYWVASHQLG